MGLGREESSAEILIHRFTVRPAIPELLRSLPLCFVLAHDDAAGTHGYRLFSRMTDFTNGKILKKLFLKSVYPNEIFMNKKKTFKNIEYFIAERNYELMLKGKRFCHRFFYIHYITSIIALWSEFFDVTEFISVLVHFELVYPSLAWQP